MGQFEDIMGEQAPQQTMFDQVTGGAAPAQNQSMFDSIVGRPSPMAAPVQRPKTDWTKIWEQTASKGMAGVAALQNPMLVGLYQTVKRIPGMKENIAEAEKAPTDFAKGFGTSAGFMVPHMLLDMETVVASGVKKYKLPGTNPVDAQAIIDRNNEFRNRLNELQATAMGDSKAAQLGAIAASPAVTTVMLALTKNPSAVGSFYGFVEGSRQARESLEAGQSFEKSAAIGVTSYAANLAIESYLGSKWLDPKIAAPLVNYIQKTGNKVLPKAAPYLLRASIESLEEVLQGATSNFLEKYGYNEKRKITDNLVMDAVGGFIGSGFGEVMNLSVGARQALKAQGMQDREILAYENKLQDKLQPVLEELKKKENPTPEIVQTVQVQAEEVLGKSFEEIKEKVKTAEYDPGVFQTNNVSRTIYRMSGPKAIENRQRRDHIQAQIDHNVDLSDDIKAELQETVDELSASIDDGFTVDRNGKMVKHEDGGQVAIYGKSIPLAQFNKDIIRAFVEETKPYYKDIPVEIGAWYNAETGNVDLDLSLNVPDLQKAAALGIAMNQRAIYDWKTGNIINTQGTGESPIKTLEDLGNFVNELKETEKYNKAVEIFTSVENKVMTGFQKDNPVANKIKGITAQDTKKDLRNIPKFLANKAFWNLANIASLDEAINIPEVHQMVMEIKDLDHKHRALADQVKTEFWTGVNQILEGVEGREESLPGEPNGLSISEQAEVLMKLMNPQSRETLIKNGINKKGDTTVYYDNGNINEAAFNDKAKALAKYCLEQYQKYGDQMVQALSNITGKEVKAVTEFYSTNVYQEFTGAPVSNIDNLITELRSTGKDGKIKDLKTSSAEHRKVDITARFFLDALSNTDNWLKNMARLTTYAKDINRLQNQLQIVLEGSNKKFGPNFTKALQDRLMNVMVGEKHEDIDQYISGMRSFAYGVMMSRRPHKIFLTQMASMFNSADAIGWKWYTRGIKAIQSQDPYYREFALADADVKGRMMDAELEDILATFKRKASKSQFLAARNAVKEFRNNVLFAPMQYMDQIQAQGTYVGAYLKATQEMGMLENDAVQYAREVLANTQGMTQTFFKPGVMQNNFGKALIMFQTQQAAVNNHNFRNWCKVQRGEMDNKEFLGHVTVNTILPGIFLAMVDTLFLKAFWKGTMEAKDILGQLAASTIQQLMVIGGVISSMTFNNGKFTTPATKVIEIPAEFYGHAKSKKVWGEKVFNMANDVFKLLFEVDLQLGKDAVEIVNWIGGL